MFDYLQKFNNLSPSLRAKVSSSSVMAIISELENKYKVDLAMLVMKVMIKSLAIKDLPTYFISELGLNLTVAENLTRELKEKIFILEADYLGLSAEKQSLDLDNNIQEFIREAGIILPSTVLIARFKNIISIYLRGIRNKIDTKNTLSKNVKIGGLDLSETEIERVLKICDSHRFVNTSQANHINKTSQTGQVNQINKTSQTNQTGQDNQINQTNQTSQTNQDSVNRQNLSEKMLPKAVPELRDEPSEMLPGPDSILSLAAGLTKPLKSPLPLGLEKIQTPPSSLKSEKQQISSITSSIPEYDLKREIADGHFKQLKISPPEEQLDLPGVEKTKPETNEDKLKISSSEKQLDSQRVPLSDKKSISPKPTENNTTKPVTSLAPLRPLVASVGSSKLAASLAPLRPVAKPDDLKSVLTLRPFKRPSFWSKFSLFKKKVTPDKKQILSKETSSLKSTSGLAATLTPKPVVTPTSTSIPKPVVTPTSTSIQKPVVTPTSTSIQKPVVASTLTPVRTPVSTPTSASTSTTTSTPKPAVTPTPTPTQKPVVAPTPTPTPTPKSVSVPNPSITRPIPQPSAIRPAMHDIKSIPKVMGPIEELQFLDVVNFRRLGKTPEEATAKILLKIKLLEKDGYDKMVAGVLAWRKSPVNRLYLRLGQEALNKDVTLKNYVSSHQEDDREYLNWEEIGALVSLNSKLIF